jgi:adenylate kinase
MATYFVAGVHGVGKTTTCANVAESLRITHLTASQIIRAEKDTAVSNATKVVTNVDANQQLLVSGVHRFHQTNRRLILDGHFSIHSREGLIKIPLAVFLALDVKGLAVFSDDPRDILSRLQNRDGKDSFSLEQIQEAQEVEISHAQSISDQLNLPLTILEAFDVEGLKSAIGLAI